MLVKLLNFSSKILNKMPNQCAVRGCVERQIKGSHFYTIPRVIHDRGEKFKEGTFERRKLWLKRIGNYVELVGNEQKHYRVCSKHFVTGM